MGLTDPGLRRGLIDWGLGSWANILRAGEWGCNVVKFSL